MASAQMMTMSLSRCAVQRQNAALSSSSVMSRGVIGANRMVPSKAFVPTVTERKAVVPQAMGAVEVAQVAGEAGFIGGVAGVMFGITLVGLAFGFILLRVESLAEEGKI